MRFSRDKVMSPKELATEFGISVSRLPYRVEEQVRHA